MYYLQASGGETMKTRAVRTIALLLLVVLASSQYARGQEAPSKDFDDYINKALKDWDVPGLAIAIVKNDQVVFARGYGVRKLGESTPVDEKTMFAIGSSSKAFTSASIAMLMDEGKLKWDDPVTKYLPEFADNGKGDITVRNLLTHFSGLREDFDLDPPWQGKDAGFRLAFAEKPVNPTDP
jgi:CubicO group peptidase (beta-lactamase class C family)